MQSDLCPLEWWSNNQFLVLIPAKWKYAAVQEKFKSPCHEYYLIFMQKCG